MESPVRTVIGQYQRLEILQSGQDCEARIADPGASKVQGLKMWIGFHQRFQSRVADRGPHDAYSIQRLKWCKCGEASVCDGGVIEIEILELYKRLEMRQTVI